VANDDALRDLLLNRCDELEYVEMAKLLIQQPERRLRLEGELKRRLLTEHVGKDCLDWLTERYWEIDCLKHRPQIIPVPSCSNTNSDIGLNLRHVMADWKTQSIDNSEDSMPPSPCHIVFFSQVFC
jgi:hypothetical protein